MSETKKIPPFVHDHEVFGEEQWVYCSQHMKAHLTGWCGVDVMDKVGLGIKGKGEKQEQEAIQKCRHLKLPLFRDLHGTH